MANLDQTYLVIFSKKSLIMKFLAELSNAEAHRTFLPVCVWHLPNRTWLTEMLDAWWLVLSKAEKNKQKRCVWSIVWCGNVYDWDNFGNSGQALMFQITNAHEPQINWFTYPDVARLLVICRDSVVIMSNSHQHLKTASALPPGEMPKKINTGVFFWRACWWLFE